jgi:hypothetical protein
VPKISIKKNESSSVDIGSDVFVALMRIETLRKNSDCLVS